MPETFHSGLTMEWARHCVECRRNVPSEEVLAHEDKWTTETLGGRDYFVCPGCSEKADA